MTVVTCRNGGHVTVVADSHYQIINMFYFTILLADLMEKYKNKTLVGAKFPISLIQ